MSKRIPPHDMHAGPDVPLGEARAFISDAARTAEGGICPCCGKYTKVYRERINATMAKGLLSGWVEAGFTREGTFACHAGSTVPQLRHWGLIESTGEREDDDRSSGHWRVTLAGVEYLYGRLAVPKYAIVFANTLLELSGENLSIYDAFKTPFDYREAMMAAAFPETDSETPLW